MDSVPLQPFRSPLQAGREMSCHEDAVGVVPWVAPFCTSRAVVSRDCTTGARSGSEGPTRIAATAVGRRGGPSCSAPCPGCAFPVVPLPAGGARARGAAAGRGAVEPRHRGRAQAAPRVLPAGRGRCERRRAARAPPGAARCGRRRRTIPGRRRGAARPGSTRFGPALLGLGSPPPGCARYGPAGLGAAACWPFSTSCWTGSGRSSGRRRWS